MRVELSARFLIGRLLWALFLALFAVAIVFLVFHVLPAGDQAVLRAGRFATPAQIELIRSEMGLDQPFYIQYAIYLGDLLRFDLGTSSRTGAGVSGLIGARLPVTLLLVAGAALVWFGAGIIGGVAGAGRQGSPGDRLAGGLSLLLVSAPVFWVGYIAIFAFGTGVGLLPFLPGVGGWDEAAGTAAKAAALLLPSLTLGLATAAIYYRLSRTSIRNELDAPYAFAARARGLESSTVLWRHAARTGLTPILGLAGLDLGLLMAGNVILVETVFNLPGLGGLLTASIDRSDLPVIQGLVLLAALSLVVVNLVADITFRLSDPRPERH